MPLQANRVADRVSTIPVMVCVRNDAGEIVEETLNVKARSLSFSRWKTFEPDDDNMDGEAILKQLAETVVDLDLIDESGQPIAPTIENLKTLDVSILGAIRKEIILFFIPRLPQTNGNGASIESGF